MSVEQDEPSPTASRPSGGPPADKLVAGGALAGRPAAGGPPPEKPVASEPSPVSDEPVSPAATISDIPVFPPPASPGVAGTTVPDGFAAGTPPPGVPFQGGPAPGGPLPPGGLARRSAVRRKRAMIIAGAAVAAAALVAVGAMTVVGDGGSEKKAPRPTVAAPSTWSLEAGQQLTAAPGLRYDGTLTVAGKPVQARLRVTRTGMASGTLTAGQLKADVIAVDGVTYIKAGLAFWRDYAGEGARPDNFAGRWSKAPATVPGFDVPTLLAPKAIAGRLAKAPAKPPVEDVNGTRAYRIKTPGADYLITATVPYRLLGVWTAGRGDPRFTVTPLPDAAPVFAELRPRVAKLGGAADPALRFAPGKLSFVNCDQNTNGCTVSVPATLSAPDTTVPDGARAALYAAVVSKGRPLGSCAGSGDVPASRALVLRCTVTGRAWRTWMKAALEKPGPHPYEAQARVIGEAVAVTAVPDLLAMVDRERRKTKPPAARPPGQAGTQAEGEHPGP
ncbi:hypothetical protein [Actinomadura macra]|uniref:hypothetical protein n=1 Tax=Actinomadura macra TaxID=46164 RepID=UPI0008314BB2|nr:hypothetical protein [Actinomadura macra]